MKRRAYMKRSPLRRRQALSRTKPMRRVGEHNWWEKLRPKMKRAYELAGITTCEFRFAGCWKDNALGFAHSLKRRNITTEEEKKETALCCNICHDSIEELPEAAMGAIVRMAIEIRETPVIL